MQNESAGRRPEPVALRPGQVIANRYEVIGMIGRGGMGAIYRVNDNVLKETVALKTLLPQFAREKTIVERFYNEARIARQLSHPNIVRVHDIGMAGQVMYISMEFLDGLSLRGMLEARTAGNRLALREVLRIFEDLCAALEYAHRFTIHRDIKPENVMITKDGTVKLMDFGISKLMSHTRMTMTSVVMGTPQYMSPEQFRDSASVDARADIYSLGVMLYEVLTGNVPTGMSRPASSVGSGVPPALDPVIARALEPEPADRYQTAAEMRAAVHEVREQVGDRDTGGVVPAARVAPAGRRVPSRVLGIVLCALIAIGALAGAAAVLGQTPESMPAGLETVAPSADTPGGRVALVGQYARSLAGPVPAEASDRRAVHTLAESLWAEAEGAGLDTPHGLDLAEQALQCYAALFLWPAQEGSAFVPAGEAALNDGQSGLTVRTGAFFIRRTAVSCEAFEKFATVVPGGWPLPDYLPALKAAGDPELLRQPLVSVPFYHAQAFAARPGDGLPPMKLPTEAQWVRAVSAGVMSDAAPGVYEWTRTPFQDLADGGYEAEGSAAPTFTENLTLCGIQATGGGSAGVARSGWAFEGADPSIRFRCVLEMPAGLDALAAFFVGGAGA